MSALDRICAHPRFARLWSPDGASPHYRVAVLDDTSPTGIALYAGKTAEAAAKLAERGMCAECSPRNRQAAVE